MITDKKKILRVALITMFISTPYLSAYYSYRSGVTVTTPHASPHYLVKDATGIALGFVGVYGLALLTKQPPIKDLIKDTNEKISKSYKDFNKKNPILSTSIQGVLSVGALVAAYHLLINK